MAFATIDVTKGITGTIPVANGGTGLTSGTTDQFLKFTGSTTIASAADNAGAVVQRVITQVTDVASDIVTGNTSFTDMGIDVTITPTNASNMIDVFFVSTMTTASGSAEGMANCYVNDQDLAWADGSVPDLWQMAYKYDSSNKYAPIVWQGRYNPSDTSQLKFTVYGKTSDSSHHFRLAHNRGSYFFSATEYEV